MYNSSDTVLTKKKLLLISKSFAILIGAATIFSYYAIKTIESNAKSREEQDHTPSKSLRED